MLLNVVSPSTVAPVQVTSAEWGIRTSHRLLLLLPLPVVGQCNAMISANNQFLLLIKQTHRSQCQLRVKECLQLQRSSARNAGHEL